MFTNSWGGFCPGNGFMQGGFMHGGFMGGGFVGMFFNILILALIAYLIFKLVQNFNGNGAAHKSSQLDTDEILRQRFARGDISEEEYLKKKKILNG